MARATRAGTVALVGPEGNSIVAWLLARVVDEGLASCALVDGAANRITQASGRPDASLVYALRVDGANLDASVDRIKRLALLMDAPLYESGPVGRAGAETAGAETAGAETAGAETADAAEAFMVDGALTAESAARLPKEARAVVVEDFTKVFLDYRALVAFGRERGLFVRRKPAFAGFSVVTRGVGDDTVRARLEGVRLFGNDIEMYLGFNPYGVGADGRVGP